MALPAVLHSQPTSAARWELCSRQTRACPTGYDPAALWLAARSSPLGHGKAGQLSCRGQNPGWDKGAAPPSLMPAGPLRAEASSRAAPPLGSAGVPGYPRVIQVPTEHPELGGRGLLETQTCDSPERGRAGAAWPARSSSARRGRGAAPSAHRRVRPFPQRGTGMLRPWPYVAGTQMQEASPHGICNAPAPHPGRFQSLNVSGGQQ